MEQSNHPHWEVPYLPIDPQDIGRNYEAIIRVNSQSGKGGVAWHMERFHGLSLPRKLQVEFSKVIQSIADETGKEISSAQMSETFNREYLQADKPWQILRHGGQKMGDLEELTAVLSRDGEQLEVQGSGSGPIEAFTNALASLGLTIRILDYQQSATGTGSAAKAISFLEVGSNGHTAWGVAEDANVITASLHAILRAVNRMQAASGAP